MESSEVAFLKRGQKLIKSSRTLLRVMGEEAVILHLDTGNYYTLNVSGREIWEFYSEPRALEQVTSLVSSRYDLDRQLIERDVAAYVETLLKERLLETMNRP